MKVVGARGRGKMVLALDAFGLKCLPGSQLEASFRKGSRLQGREAEV